MTATKQRPPLPTIGTHDITRAVAAGRKAVEAFVNDLASDQVVPFLAKAAPVSKDFEYGVKLAETRVLTEGLVKTHEWKDKDGTSHIAGEWTEPESGIVYVWSGSQGDLFVADPAQLRADLEMLDVEKTELDQALYREWKVNFTNLKNIENTALRAIDSPRTDEKDKARAKAIVQTIGSHRQRKKDGPAHLKEKD